MTEKLILLVVLCFCFVVLFLICFSCFFVFLFLFVLGGGFKGQVTLLGPKPSFLGFVFFVFLFPHLTLNPPYFWLVLGVSLFPFRRQKGRISVFPLKKDIFAYYSVPPIVCAYLCSLPLFTLLVLVFPSLFFLALSAFFLDKNKFKLLHVKAVFDHSFLFLVCYLCLFIVSGGFFFLCNSKVSKDDNLKDKMFW